MLVVETVARIRRAHLVQGHSIGRIVRDLKVSRNTVRRVIRSGATEAQYRRKKQPRPKLGDWTASLERLLAENAAKPPRERLTLMRPFEALRGEGHRGSTDAVRRHAGAQQREQGTGRPAVFVPFSFAPGAAYQPPRGGKSQMSQRQRGLVFASGDARAADQ